MLEYEARKTGRNRIFMTTPENREFAISSIADHIYKLKDMGYPADGISSVMLDITSGLINQLFNFPVDMIIEKRLYDQEIPLRPNQFLSLFYFQQENLKVLQNKEIRKLTPSSIFKANTTLNCAYAFMVDSLYSSKTDYAEAYRSSEVYSMGKILFEMWEKPYTGYRYGDEYLLIDEFARILKLENWYTLQPDTTNSKESGGPTNPQLLKSKEDTTLMYCLAALEKFENMPRDQIYAIASEVALMGTSGIDYANIERRYSLKSIPGSNFSGLELLCMMYVGFQKIEPSLNTGLDFKDAYESALKLYKPKP